MLLSVRYYFDLIDGHEPTDFGGMELPNDQAARQEATLRTLQPELSFRLERYGGYKTLAVRDETGRIICEVPIQHSSRR